MNPKVGDLWQYISDEKPICIISKIEKIGKLNTWYTICWLDDNKYQYPESGWTQLHFGLGGCFRKLS